MSRSIFNRLPDFSLTSDSRLFKNTTDNSSCVGRRWGAARAGTLQACPLSAPSTRGSLRKITAEAAELDSQRQWRITLGIVLTDNKLEETASADFEIEGSSEEAPRESEEDCTVEPEEGSEDIDVEESDDVEESAGCGERVEPWNPWPVTPVRYANLREAEKIERKGWSLRKRRSLEADSGHYPTIDPKKVKFHPRFKGLLGIDEHLVESMRYDMDVEGYKLSKPIVLATWPGQEELVVIDGHTRVKASIRSGRQKIPYVIERFDDIDGALEYVATVQAKRRSTDDWVRLRLLSELDKLWDRGGDRRSEGAKSKGPVGPNETNYKNSAERTGSLIGWSARQVKRGRRINKDATPEILEALKNHKMTIGQADKRIAEKAKAKKQTTEESQAKENKVAMVALSDENLAALEELGGNRYIVVNKAVAEYLARELKKRERSEAESPEVDDQKPGSSDDSEPTAES